MPHDEYIDCICPGGCDLVVSSSTSTTDDDGTHVSTSTSTFPAKKDDVQKAVALIKGIQKKILNSRKCDILHMPHDEYIDCICPGGCDLVVSSSTSTTDDDGTHVSTSTSNVPVREHY